MIQYWSTWNLIWFLGSKMNYFKVNNSLKTSVIVTSILGGSLVYIYPRKMTLRPFANIKYRLQYWQMITADFLFHHIPLLCTINSPNDDDSCGKYVIIPFVAWLNMNYIMKTQMNKLYGVNISRLLGSGITMLGTGGLIYHKYISRK